MSRLTKREEEILALMGRSFRGKRIAQDLGVSEFTVRKHRASIMRKLGLRTAVQLIAHAVNVARSSSQPRSGSFRADVKCVATP
jgi:DNA-binding CsgD family transcriptional regulator